MAFTPSASKKHRNKTEGELNMNSMMDMVTIILLFLLKSYSTEGVLKSSSEDLKLPKSIELKKPERKPTVEISQSVIIFDEHVVMPRAEVGSSMKIDKLYNVLKQSSDDQKKIEEYGGIFDNQILLMIDESVPFDLMVKVMNTCSRAGYWEIRLMVLGGIKDI